MTQGKYCECKSERNPVWNRSLQAYVCPECHGYRRPKRVRSW